MEDLPYMIGSYVVVMVVVFVGSALMLDDPYSRFSKGERVWVGRIGLLAPVWPLLVVAGMVFAVVRVGMYLYRVARGRA